MPTWSIRILGPVHIERDGSSFKPRTIHQALLIARLCAHSPKTIFRAETAAMLWPDTSRTHSQAYLRRGIMELRREGLAIQSNGDSLWLELDGIECDLIQVRSSAIWTTPRVNPEEVLRGIEGAVAHEVRGIVEETFHRLSTRGAESVDSESAPQNQLLGHFGAFIADSYPQVAIDYLARNPSLFSEATSQDALLEMSRKLTATDSMRSESSLQLRVLAARVARQRTKYQLADRWLSQVVPRSRERELHGILAEAYGEYSFLKMELREWEAAGSYSELAVTSAREHGEDEPLSVAYSALARTQWQIRAYDEAAKNYLLAHQHSTSRQKRGVILANLAYLWGVLQIPFDLPEADPLDESDGFYEAGANSYRLFATHFGKREFKLAARFASIQIEITANNAMDRLFCVALDCAAIAFAGLNRQEECAVCIRLSSRLRNQVGHPRAPMEKDSLRLHATGPFFGSRIVELESELRSNDIQRTARGVSRLLRSLDSR